MRISDWSSDVCSSYLGDIDAVALVEGEPGAAPRVDILLPEGRVPWSGHSGRYAAEQVMAAIEADRKIVVKGQSGSVRVDLGGSRLIKNNNTHMRRCSPCNQHNSNIYFSSFFNN